MAGNLGLRGAGCAIVAALLCTTAGCTWDRFNFFTPPAPEENPTDSFVLRGEGLVEDRAGSMPEPLKARLAQARELYRREEYAQAEAIFNDIADNSKNTPVAVQEAMFYRAECLRHQEYYPKAADSYVALLKKFPHTPYHDQAIQRMYDIANYWLNDTRQQMREDLEKKQGKRWFTTPRFVSFEKSKPLLDREGRAIQLLENVRLYDINGPLADHSLFLCGVVMLYHENYRDADHYFSQVSRQHENSQYAAKATELAIFCKHMSTGGADYDGRKVAEARKMVEVALTSYPELAHNKADWLDGQMKGITLQQAEKDYKTAEFYLRTGHPCSAYWYYDLVIRRYPQTKWAEQARVRKAELDVKREREPTRAAPPPGASPAGPAGIQR